MSTHSRFISNNPLELFSTQVEWNNQPWGLVAINRHGKVCRVNVAFEHIAGIDASAALGMSEADFGVLLTAQYSPDRQQYSKSRIEVPNSDLRAIYTFFPASEQHTFKHQLSHIAEMLREPLSVVYGFAELLLTDKYDQSTYHDLVSTILEQIGALKALCNIYFSFNADVGSDADLRMAYIGTLLHEPLASISVFADLLITQTYDHDTRHSLTTTLMEQLDVLVNIINIEIDHIKNESSGNGLHE